MESLDGHSALAALAWQIELGADECIADAPLNRYQAPAKVTPPAAAVAVKAAEPAAAEPFADDVPAIARQMAGQAMDLPALRAAMAAFDHCELKQGARNLVFSDGQPGARVMVITEAPGREEDREGRPFVGREGQMLDRMLAAITLSRTAEGPKNAAQVYITNIIPYRPPQNREPTADEIAMFLPFLERHVDLAAPEVIVLMGNGACQAVLGKRGITRLRGTWTQALGRPCLPMLHPSFLLLQGLAKRDAWADLLSLQAKLRETP